MAEGQVKKIKCPHCGWIRSINVSAIEDASVTTVTRGDTLKDVARRIRELLADKQLKAANAWLDMPTCPHCENSYRYNVRTGEVSP
jgi:phage FluMu protein Com